MINCRASIVFRFIVQRAVALFFLPNPWGPRCLCHVHRGQADGPHYDGVANCGWDCVQVAVRDTIWHGKTNYLMLVKCLENDEWPNNKETVRG